jgi:hypothetical protein
MKVKSQHVPSVTRLAEAIGLSRQWVQELMRLSDCPKVTKSGHNVTAWKAYIARRAGRNQSQAGERAKLQIDLLQARLAREQYDLSVASGEVREAIVREASDIVLKAFRMLIVRLDRLPGELPPQLVGQSAGEIRKILKSTLDAARIGFVNEFEAMRAREKVDRGNEDQNVIPFRAKAAAL